MRNIVALACIMAFATALLLAQDNTARLIDEQKPAAPTAKPAVFPCPFVGTWKLNVAKTHYEKEYKTPPEQSVVFTIAKADETGIAWNATATGSSGELEHLSYAGPNDGKDHPFGTQGVTVASTSTGNEVIVTWKDASGNVVERSRNRYSSDCNRWTHKVFSVDKGGKEVLMQTEVFERQPAVKKAAKE